MTIAEGKPIRWTQHALQSLAAREIAREEADSALDAPDLIVPGQPPRQIFMRRYQDAVLQRDMLLRVVVEETVDERVVITAYKTSQIVKYLEGGTK